MRSGAFIVAALAALTCFASPPSAQARWMKAESAQFVVYADGDEPQLRDFTRKLELFDALLRKITSTQAPPSPSKFRVYLVAGQHDLHVVGPDLPPQVAGFYTATSTGTLAVAVRNDMSDGLLTGQAIVFHEYTHRFVAQYYPGAYPIWYQEGFAEYCSTTEFTKDGIKFGLPAGDRLLALKERIWSPMADIITPRQTYLRLPEMFYPQSWLATHYLLRDPARQSQLMTYLRAIEKGQDAKAAFTAAFGMDFDGFENALKVYLAHGATYSVLRPLDVPPATINVTSLTPAQQSLVLDDARMLAEDVTNTERAGFVAQVEADAAPYPDDPDALRAVGMAHALFGDLTKADSALDRLLTLRPDDVDANWMKGVRWVMAGWKDPPQRMADFERARTYLGRVLKSDANHYSALWLYGLTFDTGTGVPPDITSTP